jgi:hypothetical protein
LLGEKEAPMRLDLYVYNYNELACSLVLENFDPQRMEGIAVNFDDPKVIFTPGTWQRRPEGDYYFVFHSLRKDGEGYYAEHEFAYWEPKSDC